MVGDPVKDDLHSKAVCAAHKVLQVFESTILRVNLLEVLDAVR